MIVTITINTANAAFADGNAGTEVARILRELAADWDGGESYEGILYDINGNRVGRCILS